MAMSDELDIARDKRGAALGPSAPPARPEPEARPEAEGLLSRTARRDGWQKTRDADKKLQDTYREKHGLDEYNRPKPKRSLAGVATGGAGHAGGGAAEKFGRKMSRRSAR